MSWFLRFYYKDLSSYRNINQEFFNYLIFFTLYIQKYLEGTTYICIFLIKFVFVVYQRHSLLRFPEYLQFSLLHLSRTTTFFGTFLFISSSGTSIIGSKRFLAIRGITNDLDCWLVFRMCSGGFTDGILLKRIVINSLHNEYSTVLPGSLSVQFAFLQLFCILMMHISFLFISSIKEEFFCFLCGLCTKTSVIIRNTEEIIQTSPINCTVELKIKDNNTLQSK